jgi:gliding motility-associated-like protein
MKTKQLSVCVLLFSGVLLCNAQVVNVGQLYVSPNTLMSVMSDFDNQQMGEYENNGEVLFRGSFNNDGITSFNPAYKGYTRFEGFKNQNITGAILSEFNNVLFANVNPQPAFHLVGDISVSGEAEFSNGIVNNDDFGGSILFTQKGTHTGTSNDSHVDGEVAKEGDGDFLYPIGDKGLFRYAAISAPGVVSADFTGKYFYENSNLLYPHASKADEIDTIDEKEYWRIEKVKSTNDVLVTLSWDDSTTTPASIVVDPQEAIHIVRWDDVQKLWVDEGGVVDNSNKTVTTSSLVSGYGIFTLARVKTNLIDDGGVVVYNGVTPNGDGMNDYFFIDGITKYPKNKVLIFNRWGVKVFETTNYGSSGNVFDGRSDGRVTIKEKDGLPTGTYFYVMEYEYAKTGRKPSTIKKAGYLYVKNAE